jgi:deoxyribonuclease-4
LKNIYLGCHLSISKGYAKAALEAVSIGANTFQFFTRNPRGGNAKAVNEKDIAKLHEIMKENNFGPLLAHAPYTMNLCSDKEDIRNFAKGILKEDIERMKYLPEARFLFHPGSHVGQGAEKGISFIVDALNEVITEDEGPVVLLEGMSGKGSEIGRSFEELAQIIQGVKHNKRMGIIIDTCHMHSAGYDIVNDLDGVFAELDRVIGLERIGGVHVNDNMNDLGCHKDRHAKIGEGSIGLEAIAALVSDERLAGLPFNLETPNELEGYAAEIKMIREKIG